MAITDPDAIKFSNEQARVGADLLARAYYRCDAARDRWDGLAGDEAAKIAVMGADIRAAADAVIAAYLHAYLSEKIWFLGVNSLFPNTTEEVSDGSAADGRPAATGAKVIAVMSRAIEFQNWLLSASGSFTDSARGSLAYFNTVLAASTYNNGTPLDASSAGNLMNRCGELRTNYEASSGANLNSILAFAVNPQL
jgi:hypothetical protein